MTRRELALVADDDPLGRDFLAEALSASQLDVECAADGQEAIERLRREPFDLVFTDLRMPRATGLDVLRAAKAQDPDRPVVIVTAHGTLSVAVEGVRAGADDLLEKPLAVEDVELALLRVRERAHLRRENRFHRARNLGPDDDIVAESAAMRAVLDVAARVAPSPIAVLLRGESGTGKERLAALIHRRSDRREGPFVKINAAAVPETLVESEFFGHEAGAFTGARTRRQGCFELADKGTLFLDEIGEMPASLQAKLLRVLQDGEFCRVGGSRPQRVDVRVVAATNRDLEAAIADGGFREDLFYRLNVVPLLVPPLRERRADILPLARRFLGDRVTLAEDAEALLLAHDWPGNVRELQNVLQRASLLSPGRIVRRELLEPWLAGHGPVLRAAPPGDPIEALVGRELRDVEEALIAATLRRHAGNRTQAARTLGIGVRTLFDRLKRRTGVRTPN